MKSPDVIIAGSGVGGATTALRLASRGLSVLILERGDHLPREADNWSAQAVYIDRKYTARETWVDGQDKPFAPSVFYNVGGATKFYGCTMIRFRPRDFEDVEHEGGLSPAWPVTYAEMEPWYAEAEQLFHVMGTAGIDPTAGPRSTQFPHAGVESDLPMKGLAERLRAQGLNPYPQEAAIHMSPLGGCIRCGTCDGYPCRIDAKADAEISALRPALATGRVALRTNTLARRVLLSPDGKTVTGIEVETGGTAEVLTARTYVLAASAINSAAILLRSATSAAPKGAANSSDQVGRNYMTHNNSAMMAIGPARNRTVFAKTLTVNDFYFGDDEFRWPMGCIMSLGKLRAGVMTAANPLVPTFINRMLADRSYDWWIMSEDLPMPENRISLSGDRIRMDTRRNNLRAHQELTRRAARAMRRAGLPLILTKLMPVATTSHQCGTARFGTDPATSVLDPFCRTWDHRNLFVIDASFFPSSAAVNPALTIAAQSLRAADHIAATDFGIAAAA
jgi:choline dehydrogenase-like flavoprotein